MSDPEVAAPAPPGRGRAPGIAPLVADVLAGALAAIDEELDALATTERRGIELVGGHPAGAIGADRLWTFEFDADVDIAPDTPAALVVAGREPVAATVLAAGDQDLVLAVRDELGEHVDTAWLRTDTGFILAALRSRLAPALEDPDTDDRPLASLLGFGASFDAERAGPGRLHPGRSIDPLTVVTTRGSRFRPDRESAGTASPSDPTSVTQPDAHLDAP